MKRILTLALFLISASAAYGQHIPPAQAGYCLNPSAQWIPIAAAINGTGISIPPPAVSVYGQNGTTWYGLLCDASGNITAGSFATGSALPATCSPQPQSVYALATASGTLSYYCSSTNTWTLFSQLPGNGVWQRAAGSYTVVYPLPSSGSKQSGEPTILPSGPEGNCKVLTGLATCFKMLVTLGSNTFYAESADGGNNWSFYAGGGTNGAVISNCARNSWIEPSAGSYLAFCVTTSDKVSQYSSSDGVTWSLVGTVIDGTGTSTDYTNSFETLWGGVMYMFVEVDNAPMQIFTSPSPYSTFTFLQNANAAGAPYWGGPSGPFLINGTYYLWVHSLSGNVFGTNFSSVIARMSSSSLTGPYTITNMEIYPQSFDEGAGLTSSNQTADPDIFPYTDPTGAVKTYLYYSSGFKCGASQYSYTNMAIFDGPMSSLVQTNGGWNAGSFAGQNVFGEQYDCATGGINMEGHPIENAGAYTGTTLAPTGNVTMATGTTLTVPQTVTGVSDIQVSTPSAQDVYIESGCSTTSCGLVFAPSFKFYPGTNNSGEVGDSGQYFANMWSNRIDAVTSTAATSSTCSVPGPIAWRGFAWHGGASTQNDTTATMTCVGGTDGAETLTYANTGSTGAFTVTVTGAIAPNSPQTAVNCSTSGTATYAESLTGTSNKTVKVYLAACLGTASYTFPTAFNFTPAIVTTNEVAGSVVTALSTTAMTVTGATTTGFIVIEGW